ncbi:Crp/Fnr family transcriptional regulator [Phormidium sp. LEGE 05292]|uniref:Crp/Fnr family transcriptional regulator n=1 Tax=[Phormidium] sp. LEGE 05292 TaxID=767427 RepID=UPI001880C306|nr:Crp/Fnr family transcriptional regulator [Phormidium sp. LEGE 05292]MBE9223940.1 Crp/Fnr family transcriptional regulator [Phormidium sp. LEGE 05292]
MASKDNQKSIDLQEFLSNSQMFFGLPTDEVDALLSIAQQQTYQKGETIFWEGDAGTGFFLVISGKVKVFKISPEGKEQILQVFGAHEHFAEVPAFDGQPFPASAAALEKTELLFFPRTTFLELIKNNPSLAVNLLKIFARHLRRFAKVIEDLSLREVPGRFAAYLLYLSDRTGNQEEVELDLTKGQLAALLGTIPETLSRVFAKLSQEEIISLNGSTVKLLNLQRLKVLGGTRE